jgi:hypothetical protein
MIGETCDTLQQGVIMSYMSLSWGLGCVAGPSIGGVCVCVSSPCIILFHTLIASQCMRLQHGIAGLRDCLALSYSSHLLLYAAWLSWKLTHIALFCKEHLLSVSVVQLSPHSLFTRTAASHSNVKDLALVLEAGAKSQHPD